MTLHTLTHIVGFPRSEIPKRVGYWSRASSPPDCLPQGQVLASVCLQECDFESRTVALSTAALEAFRAMRARPRRIDGRVFGWAGADSFEKTWVRCKVRALAAYSEACKQAGTKPDPAFLADLRFHDLRHEATSRLFEKGLGIMEVASMTGHKSLSMLKRYTHVEAEKLAAKLG